MNPAETDAPPGHATASQATHAETAASVDLIADLARRAHTVEQRFEGRRIRWRRFGAGRPLVLLHGGNGSWLHWARNIDALSARHTLWLPDLPGCGDSDELAEPTTLARLVQALQRGLDEWVGPETEIDLAAFSFGSVLASHLALQRGRVRRLALLGPTGHGQSRSAIGFENWRLLPAGAAQDTAHRHNLQALMLHDPAAIDALALTIHRAASEATRLRSKALSHTDHTRRALAQLTLPLQLIWGDHDPTAGDVATTAHTLMDGRAERRLDVLSGAGHWIQYERAEAVNQRLDAWFS